jgi:hypothetical protein
MTDNGLAALDTALRAILSDFDREPDDEYMAVAVPMFLSLLPDGLPNFQQGMRPADIERAIATLRAAPDAALYRVWDRVASLRLTGDWTSRKCQVLDIIAAERAALATAKETPRARRRRALLALYRNHPATAPGERYNWKARAEATRQREMLLGWAATQSDETLLDCRNLGPTTLRWIRDQTGDPPSPFADLEATIATLRAALDGLVEAAEAYLACDGSGRRYDAMELGRALPILRAALAAAKEKP